MNRFIAATLCTLGLGLACAFAAEPQAPAPSPAAPVAAPAAQATDASTAEPAVQTSSAANVPAKGQGQGKGKGKGAPGKPADGSKAHDYIELETMQVTGNRELPNVMYVVPWKKPDLGDFAGRPPKSLLDEMLAPVDREVFQRQNRYFAALQPDAAGGGKPTGAAPAAPGSKPAAPAAAPATGPVPGPGSGDEK